MNKMKKVVIALIIVGIFVVAEIFVYVFRTLPKDKAEKQRTTIVANKVSVTILPIKYLVDKITDGNLNIEVLVPPGASPESYEPVPQQIISLTKSRLVFSTGLIAFENELINKLGNHHEDKIVNLSKRIELISGEHAHGDHKHAGGVDPHIWTSPKALKIMAQNIYNALAVAYPDSVKYADNHRKLQSSLDYLDIQIADILKDNDVKYFLIYHPALTYYSNDYGIKQLSIEQDGKEPSVEQLKRIIDQVRGKQGEKKILYQKEFSRSNVETIARDINAEIVEIDPLAEDIAANLLLITKLISE